MSSVPDPTRPILLIGPDDPSISALAHRLTGLEIPALEVADMQAAHDFFSERPEAVAMAAIPSEAANRQLKGEVKRLRKVSGQPKLGLVAVGTAPDASVRKRLRSAGVRLALWEPYDDTTLRFLLNRATCSEADSPSRSALRVPAHIRATIRAGQRSKEALVYSLSTEGLFLSTPRAQMEGATLHMELALPDASVEAEAQVVFANVPGDMQRHNLPVGMGARFKDLSGESASQIRAYVDARLAELEV